VKRADTLTILAYKTSYKGLVEAVGVISRIRLIDA
jgi:hypothetical protein